MMRFFITFTVCAAFGVLGFFTLQTYNLYIKERVALVRERGTQFSFASSLWRHGIVEAIDPEKNTLLVRLQNSVNRSGFTDSNPILIHVTNSTSIAEQELISDGTQYTGLTVPTPAQLSDLTLGTRVALLLENHPEEGVITARVILFGNPL